MEGETRVGTVGFEEGKYFLEVEGRRWELEAGVIISDGRVEDLVGQEVEVLYSEPTRFVVGLVTEKFGGVLCYVRPRPTCYYPADPWLLRGVEREVRVNLAKGFLEEKLISKEVFEKLV